MYALYEALQTLENEDPALGVTRADGRLRIQCMGPVQTEILQQAIWERFGIRAEFGDCRVSYRETIAAPIIGYGHYEPLRITLRCICCSNRAHAAAGLRSTPPFPPTRLTRASAAD